MEDAVRLTATKLKHRAVNNMNNTHWSRENTLWHPVVVKSDSFARYLSKMVCQRQSSLFVSFCS